MDELSEKEIIEKIRRGQIEYFSFLVKKYSPIVFYYVNQRIKNTEDSNDIVQNSFIKIYKAIGKLDLNKQFYPYFFSIVKNEIIEFYRRRKQTLPLFDESAIETPEPLEEAIDFKMVLNELTDEHKKVLTLYYIEGYSYKDIAQKIRKPLNTVKTLIRRAKIDLRRKYAID